MSANDKPAKRTKAFSKKGLALWVLIVILTILTVIAMVWAGNQPDFSEPTKPLSDVATWSSSPEEFHLQALTQRYVNLSIHTAPIVQPYPDG